jgi:hypothetical protein
MVICKKYNLSKLHVSPTNDRLLKPKIVVISSKKYDIYK